MGSLLFHQQVSVYVMTPLPTRPRLTSSVFAASGPRWVERSCLGGKIPVKRRQSSLKIGKRAAAYIRVSDESQLEGHSLDAQRAEIERWCERRGYQLVKVYVEEGKTAHTDQMDRRPQLLALLENAKADQFDIVVVHMIDRWARNMGVQSQALQLLGERGVGFASVMEDFDYTTPSGKLMLTMMGA